MIGAVTAASRPTPYQNDQNPGAHNRAPRRKTYMARLVVDPQALKAICARSRSSRKISSVDPDDVSAALK